MPRDQPSDQLLVLAGLPGVAPAVERARVACDDLRWHQAMRRRGEQCRAEAVVHAARASAALEGAEVSLAVVRRGMLDAETLPDDPTGRVVTGALRAIAVADELAADGCRALSETGRQALVRLHVAAQGGLAAPEELGRPRRAGETPRGPRLEGVEAVGAGQVAHRLAGVLDLIGRPGRVPVAVLGAVVLAELLVIAPFTDGNGVVARALTRSLSTGLGLDPTGTAVPETAMLADPVGRGAALGAYQLGTTEGVARWVRWYAGAVEAGAVQGGRIADSVLRGEPV